jgi:hypothetical protein
MILCLTVHLLANSANNSELGVECLIGGGAVEDDVPVGIRVFKMITGYSIT